MKRYTAIDSSTAQDTAYDTFGRDEVGTDPMMRPGVNGLGDPGPGDARGLWLFTPVERRYIVEEMEKNPSFAPDLDWMLRQPGAKNLIDRSVRNAVLNELDPQSNTASQGQWATLRARLRTVIRYIPQAIDEGLKKVPFQKKVEILEALNKGAKIRVVPMGDVPPEGLGFLDALVTSIAGAASSIYGASVTSSTQKQIAQIQASSITQSNEAQIAMAKAQAAIAQAQVQQAAIQAGYSPAEVGVTVQPGAQALVPGGAPGTVLGMPLWAIPVGIGALGLILYLAFKR